MLLAPKCIFPAQNPSPTLPNSKLECLTASVNTSNRISIRHVSTLGPLGDTAGGNNGDRGEGRAGMRQQETELALLAPRPISWEHLQICLRTHLCDLRRICLQGRMQTMGLPAPISPSCCILPACGNIPAHRGCICVVSSAAPGKLQGRSQWHLVWLCSWADPIQRVLRTTDGEGQAEEGPGRLEWNRTLRTPAH